MMLVNSYDVGYTTAYGSKTFWLDCVNYAESEIWHRYDEVQFFMFLDAILFLQRLKEH